MDQSSSSFSIPLDPDVTDKQNTCILPIHPMARDAMTKPKRRALLNYMECKGH
jgi:hypothetical protein